MKRATRAWDSEIRQRWLRSWTDRHGPVEEAEPAPVAARRRIGNRFPPPPLFLHEPGRFQGTQVDTSRLDGCQQTLDVERVRPQATRRQLVTETRSHGFDSLLPDSTEPCALGWLCYSIHDRTAVSVRAARPVSPPTPDGLRARSVAGWNENIDPTRPRKQCLRQASAMQRSNRPAARTAHRNLGRTLTRRAAGPHRIRWGLG